MRTILYHSFSSEKVKWSGGCCSWDLRLCLHWLLLLIGLGSMEGAIVCSRALIAYTSKRHEVRNLLLMLLLLRDTAVSTTEEIKRIVLSLCSTTIIDISLPLILLLCGLLRKV